MGLFDNVVGSLKSGAAREIKKQVQGAVNGAVKEVIKKTESKEEKFVFNSLPVSVDELKSLPEANLDSAFKTAALTIAVLCNYEKDPEGTFSMLDVLKGPEPMSSMDKSRFKDRLNGKYYKLFSYFEGATVDNSYTPNTPYTITVYQNASSFTEENRATMYVKSSGADSMRPVTLRKKPSSGQWFLYEFSSILLDIRMPKSEDKWA